MKNKRRLKILALTLLATFTSATLITSTVAWFKYGANVNFGSENGGDPKLKAGVETFYYAGGTGTQNDPFIISNRTHLYNLAWLQYIGTYNTPTIQQKYFKIQLPDGVTELNMTGLTLPPIGTDTYPFLGNFDGNGATITNLTVSNDDPKQTDSAFGSAKPNPTSIPNAAIPPEVVGFFGVVGKLPNQNITYNSQVVSVTNVVLKNLTVVSETSNTLIGLAAGYIDGNMRGVRVSGNAKLDLSSGTKQIVNSNITENVSDYGLVGYSAQATESVFKQEISKYYASDDPENGSDNWGGSVDIHKYNNWIYSRRLSYTDNNREKYTIAKNAWTNDPDEDTDYYHLRYRSVTDVTEPSSSYASQYKVYANPDYFDDPQSPFSMMGAGTGRILVNYVDYELNQEAYIPLKFVETDETKWNTVPDNNTGYIAGSYTGNYKYTPYFTSSHNDVLQNSISDTHITRKTDNATSHTDFQRDDMKTLSVATFSYTDDDWVVIQDKYNASHTSTNSSFTGYSRKTATALGLNKYADARDQLFDYDSMEATAKPRIHGMRFQGEVISSSKTVTIPTAKIANQTYTNYKVPAGSIDFNLKEDGSINFFAGSYSSTAVSYITFFSLYKVNRSGSNVSSLQRITAIYKNTQYASDHTKPQYVYDLVNEAGTSTTTSGTKGDTVFEASKTIEKFILYNGSGNNVLNNTLVYFEVPVMAGEYAIGMVPFDKTHTSSNTTGGSLIYLDIGSNGSDAVTEKVTGYNITTTKGGLKFPVGVDFEVVGTTGTNAITSGGVSFCVQIDSGVTGSTTFNITSTNVTISSPSMVSKYSYKGSNYSDEATLPSGKFKVTNGPNSSLSETTQITRVSHIKIGNVSEILVTDVLNGASISSTKYTYNGTDYTSNDNSNGPVIPSAITTASSAFTKEVVVLIRGQTAAITLTRNNTGTITTFNSVLPLLPWNSANASFDGVYNVTIDPYPLGLIINPTRSSDSYSLKINTNNIVFDSNNEGQYPTT